MRPPDAEYTRLATQKSFSVIDRSNDARGAILPGRFANRTGTCEAQRIHDDLFHAELRTWPSVDGA